MKPFFANIFLVLLFLFDAIGSEMYFQDEKDNLLKTQWTTDEGLPQKYRDQSFANPRRVYLDGGLGWFGKIRRYQIYDF